METIADLSLSDRFIEESPNSRNYFLTSVYQKLDRHSLPQPQQNNLRSSTDRVHKLSAANDFFITMNKFELAESMSTADCCLAEQVIRVYTKLYPAKEHQEITKKRSTCRCLRGPVDVPSLITCRPPSHQHNQTPKPDAVFASIDWTQIFAPCVEY